MQITSAAVGTESVTNSIFWDDDDSNISASDFMTQGNTFNITYSDMPFDWEGEGNISSNPYLDDNYVPAFGTEVINAGDPNSPLDPDGTTADMGAFYYDLTNLLGCTDPDALNYDPTATVDDGCCSMAVIVTPVGSDETGDGSECRPFATIQQALNEANENDPIHVAAGTYTENILWPATNGIKLIGENRETTIIDGNQSGSVIRFEEDLDGIINNSTELKSFTIQNGLLGGTWEQDEPIFYGGGIYLENSSPTLTLKEVTITANSAS